MSVIIRAHGNDGTPYHYGPFCNKEQAEAWGATDLKGFEWHVEDLNRPGSTYATCLVPDIVDFIHTVQDKSEERTCYVTVDGVNWAVEVLGH